jgi:CBS domain-containing membrane protein
MLNLRCLHPPGAATALAPVLGNFHPVILDKHFLWMPVGVNVLLMMGLALLVNRLLGRNYPARTTIDAKLTEMDPNQSRLIGLSLEDIEQATQHIDHFIDISADDLCQIFTRLQLLSFQRNRGPLTCGDIMMHKIITVEFGTEVESAWQLMHEHHLTVLPVLDNTRHVIGIVTRYDFFKNVKLTPYASFQDKLHAFIKRTPDISANKPEAVGQIMTRQVKILPITAQAAEAIPLIVNEGHHHVPIVDDQGHFVGMLFQSRLLAMMFSQGAIVQQH